MCICRLDVHLELGREQKLKNLEEEKAASQSKWRCAEGKPLQIFSFFLQPEILLLHGTAILIF